MTIIDALSKEIWFICYSAHCTSKIDDKLIIESIKLRAKCRILQTIRSSKHQTRIKSLTIHTHGK